MVFLAFPTLINAIYYSLPDIETVTEIESIGGAAAVEVKVGMRMTGIMTMRKSIAAEAAV